MKPSASLNGKLHLSTFIFFLLFVTSSFSALLCLDESKLTEGIVLMIFGFIFLGITIGSSKKIFFFLISGTFIYISWATVVIYFFPKIISNGVGFISPYIYLLIVLLLLIYLIVSFRLKKKPSQ